MHVKYIEFTSKNLPIHSILVIQYKYLIIMSVYISKQSECLNKLSNVEEMLL